MTDSKSAPTLLETDVRDMVRLVGEVVSSRHDHSVMKRQLMDGLCRLVEADAWVWCLGCEMEAGKMPVYLSMDHGGFDEARYAAMLRAAAHPDLTWISETMIRDMREKNTQVTRLREQFAARDELAVAGIATHMREADIGPFLIVMRPIDARSVSTLGLYRREPEPAFTERECRIAHVILSEVPWLLCRTSHPSAYSC